VKAQTSIFFDLDGTLSDPRDGICRSLQSALEELRHACPPDEQLARYIGPPLHESFAQLLESNDAALIGRALELYWARFASQGIFENTVYTGIPELMEALQEHCELYVVTTKPTLFARRIVDHFALEKYFRNVHGSELDGTRADKTELIMPVIGQEQINPGDALANGVYPIGVLWGYDERLLSFAASRG
jgi:phosphoglycolate phosphatase